MGRYALILVATLVLLSSYFVLANNRLRQDSLHNAMELNAYNQSKNIANSAVQIGITNIINQVWDVVNDEQAQEEIWYLDGNANWSLAQSAPQPVFHPWADLSGLFALTAVRDGDIVTLTSLGRMSENSPVEQEVKAVLQIEIGGDSIMPDFDGMFSKNGINFANNNARVKGKIGTNFTGNESVFFSGNNLRIDGGNLTIANTGDISVFDILNAVDNDNYQNNIQPAAGEDHVDLIEDPIHFPSPSFPPFQDNLGLSKGNLSGDSLIDSDGLYGDITVGNHNTLTIQTNGGTRKIRANKLEVSNHGNVIIEGGGVVILHITGSFDGGKLNSTGDPGDMFVYYESIQNSKFHNPHTEINGNLIFKANENAENVLNFQAGARLNGLIYAPDFKVDIKAGAKIVGNVIAEEMEIRGTGNVDYNIEFLSAYNENIHEIETVPTEEKIVHRFSY